MPKEKHSSNSKLNSKSDSKPKKPELVLDGEYHDGQIVSYVRTQIAQNGGLAANSDYMLQNQPNGIIMAFGHPVNVGGMGLQHGGIAAMPVRAAFDRHSLPVGNALGDKIQDLLDEHDGAAFLLAVQASDVNSIRQLGENVVNTPDNIQLIRQTLQGRLAGIQAVNQRDMFDEIIPAMGLDQNQHQARILFPFNTRGGGHWVTGEINITRTYDAMNGYRYAVDMTAHDPYGDGSGINQATSQEIANAVFRRIREQHNAAFPMAQVAANNFRFRSVPSPYEQIGRQHEDDNVSCGIIAADEILTRLNNQPINQVHAPLATPLRQAQLDFMRNTLGEDSLVYQGFIRGYADAPSKESALKKETAKKETDAMDISESSSSEKTGMKLTSKEIQESLMLELLYTLSGSVKPDSKKKEPSPDSKEHKASKEKEPKPDNKEHKSNKEKEPSPSSGKPLFQKKAVDIFASDDKSLQANIEHVKGKKPLKSKKVKKDKKEEPTSGYRHKFDPNGELFKTEKECLANARENIEDWREQLKRPRDLTARVLDTARGRDPNTKGQPKNAQKPDDLQKLATLLHNRVESERTKASWDVVDEAEDIAKKNKGFAPLTTNTSVVRFSPTDIRAISAENGTNSAMTPFRRTGVELSGIEPISLQDCYIGPWTLDAKNKHKVNGRDARENSPFMERIPVISNIDSGRGNTRHAEANTIAYLFSEADYQIRRERAAQESKKTGKDVAIDYDTAISAEAVKARVQTMLLDTATDKPHCAECAEANSKVFGKNFNSSTPKEQRLFENWGEPFPGFYDMYGESTYRSIDRSLKKEYKPGMIGKAKEIKPFAAKDIEDLPKEPMSPSAVYEEIETGSKSTTKPKSEPVTKSSSSSKEKPRGGRAAEAYDFNVAVEMVGVEQPDPKNKGKGNEKEEERNPKQPPLKRARSVDEGSQEILKKIAKKDISEADAAALSRVASDLKRKGASGAEEVGSNATKRNNTSNAPKKSPFDRTHSF